jgi:hypothetical protein
MELHLHVQLPSLMTLVYLILLIALYIPWYCPATTVPTCCFPTDQTSGFFRAEWCPIDNDPI